ncbi:MAG: ATP/GTP-binding protein [Promethearchaeota archaeon]
MIFDDENKTILLKIVYYGPAMSGKTTSLKYLFSYFKKSDRVESIESTTGRTLFFDFGVLLFKGLNWDLKLLLYSATGQDFYSSTRPATLRGVDGIIFVVDSQVKYLERNINSWNELKNYFGEKLYDIPIVISLNKSDLYNIEKIEESDFFYYLGLNNYKSLSFNKTVALNGCGILESFQKIITFIFPHLEIINN